MFSDLIGLFVGSVTGGVMMFYNILLATIVVAIIAIIAIIVTDSKQSTKFENLALLAFIFIAINAASFFTNIF